MGLLYASLTENILFIVAIFTLFRNPGYTPTATGLGVGAGGTLCAPVGSFLKLALYGGKNCANVGFGFYLSPAAFALNNTGNTTGTTRAHPALKSTRYAAIQRAAGAILRQID